jgi:hypothetical protein
MSIEKKSLISTLQSTKKANVAKETVSGDASKSATTKNPIQRNLIIRRVAAAKNTAEKKMAKK